MDTGGIVGLARSEARRQRTELSLIASENLIWPGALALTRHFQISKYSEGYPGRRFYRGCKWVDRLEEEAIGAAKELFNCKYANVQCFSGSIANLAIYGALLKPGETILAMEMSAGGHLTHGSPHSFVSRYYSPVTYGVARETGRINYEEVERIALEKMPRLIVAGYSSYPYEIDFRRFREIADRVGAYLLADICHLSGLIATGLHPHCFPHAHVAMTTTHKQLRGHRGALVLWNDDDLTIPLNKSVFPGHQGGMNPAAIAVNAYCLRRDLEPDYKTYMEAVVKNTKILLSYFREKGLAVSGSDTHLLLLDTMSSFRLTGKDSSLLLESAGYITNPNLIPFDTQSPLVASGIRLGTLCLSTLEPSEEEVRWIAEQIWLVLINRDKKTIAKARRDLRAWLSKRHRE